MIAVILNARAGSGQADRAATEIEELFGRGGHPVRVTLAGDPTGVREAVALAIARKAAAIVVGGGDGTQSSVANLLAGRDIPLGVLPLGTFNHFAKDLGLPLELDAAVAVVLGGRTIKVDVGEVNGHVFVNNSSLGLYPAIVRLRGRFPARGIRKLIVAIWATLRELRRNRKISVRLEVDHQAVVRRTPIVLIANNAYRMVGLEASSRDSLCDGRLAVYIAAPRGKGWLPRLLWKILMGRAEGYELEVLRVEQAVIETKASRVEVALDGEVLGLDAPLQYRIRPGALRVFVPADDREAGAAAR